MEALKTSFLPNLSIESTVVSNGHFCSMCGEQFEGSQQAIEHMHLCHGGLSAVTGVSGDNIIVSSHNVNSNTSNHMKIDYSCHSCDEKFSSIQDLEEHLRLIHQNSTEIARCPACNFYGMTANSLQEPDEFKCSNCGAECTSTSLTSSEVRSFHSRTSESSRTSLPGHSMKMRSQTINQYEQGTHNRQQQQTQQQHQQQQRRKVHERNGLLKVPPLTVKLNKNTNSNSPMNSHVTIKQEPSNGDGVDAPSIYSIHQAPYAVSDVVISTTQTHASNIGTTNAAGGIVNKVRHKCPNCSKTFKSLGTLAMHRKIHTGEADLTPKHRPFQCTYCGKSFTQSNSLKLHTRIHTGEKPFRCGYCGRAFTVKDYLNKHLTTHTGEKPFQCSYCDKSFSVKDYLTKHIRTHTGEKPYTCSYCEKRFTQRSALTVHTTKLHP